MNKNCKQVEHTGMKSDYKTQIIDYCSNTDLDTMLEDEQFPIIFDRALHAFIGRYTLGLAPSSLALAFFDWLIHLGISPGKVTQLQRKFWRKVVRFMAYAYDYHVDKDTPPCIEPLPYDHRFASAHWQQAPFNFIYQAFLLQQQWWHNATSNVRGVSKHHEQVLAFSTRQLLDMFSPSNFIFTNPDILQQTITECGMNLWRGWQYWLEDAKRKYLQQPPVGLENFKLGENIATSRGKVIYKNNLMELIQYSPTTKKVYAEPILITSAWIMKYYILDLSEHNSLVKYLRDKGHTVFMISWKNPGSDERDVRLVDYLRLGIMAALEVIQHVIPKRQVHLVGYCLGGTLAVIAAAHLANRNEQRLKSLTLLAAQTDFRDAGELMLFVDESQVNWLEDMMWERGYLSKYQMAGAFELLRSYDLIWSRLQTSYLLGERKATFDLMAWSEDATRMPYKMHSEYLRQLFLNNELVEGKYTVDDRAIVISNIKIPIAVVATEQDHVAPWLSVFKIHLFADTDVTFMLATGGHNAGIISEPGHKHRHFRMRTIKEGEKYLKPSRWYHATEQQEGSWWPSWQTWLQQRSQAEQVAAPQMGAKKQGYAALYDAPGEYIKG